MKIKFASISLIAMLLLFARIGSTQENNVAANPTAKKIDDYLVHLERNDQFMGSVTVVKNGQTIHNEAYGFLTIEESGKKIEANPNTAYRIGSITKTFTSVLINQLAEAGRISMDDKLSRFFPNVKNADQITIDQLLRHRSGLKNLTSTAGYLVWSKQAQSRDDMIERIEQLPADFTPGEKTEYSNTNYLLLGYIIEKIYGKPYGTVLREKITEPLGMRRTFFEPEDPIENVADSFRHINRWIPVPETHQSVPHGAGAIVSTSDDLVIFMKTLFAEELINKASLDRMMDTSNGLGQGLMAIPFGNKRAFGHGGGIDGFRSNLAFFPKDDVTISVCGNGVVYPFNDLMIGCLRRTFEIPAELPSFESVDVDAEILRQYEGLYASEGFPLKITISVDENGTLAGQATGQSAFPFTAVSETEFKFDAASIKVNFFESKKGQGFDGFKFSQGPNNREFKKEEK